MTKQPEALFLAECIDRDNYGAASTQIEFRASKELRRLHEEVEVLMKALSKACGDDEETVLRAINAQPVQPTVNQNTDRHNGARICNP